MNKAEEQRPLHFFACANASCAGYGNEFAADHGPDRSGTWIWDELPIPPVIAPGCCPVCKRCMHYAGRES